MAAAGHTVYMSHRPNGSSMEKAMKQIETSIDGLIREGLADESYRQKVTKNLHCITNDDIPKIGQQVDFVFESVFEKPEVKRSIFKLLNDNIRKDVILASNTSAMNIFGVLDGVVDDPDRVIIAHWFNPPHLMKLVEVVKGPQTSQKTTDTTVNLLQSIGQKTTVLNKFIPGFVVNRLAVVISRELCSMIEKGYVTAEDADTTLRYTDGLRWGFEGPLPLVDYVGIGLTTIVGKTVLPSLCNDMDSIHYGEKLISEGKMGASTGEGLLKWDNIDAYTEKRNRRIIEMARLMQKWDKEDSEE